MSFTYDMPYLLAVSLRAFFDLQNCLAVVAWAPLVVARSACSRLPFPVLFVQVSISSGWCGSAGEGEGDSAEAEVDHCGEGVGVGVPVAAALDDSDLGV